MNPIKQFLQNNVILSRFFQAPWEMRVILVFGLGLVLAFCFAQVSFAIDRYEANKALREFEEKSEKKL